MSIKHINDYGIRFHILEAKTESDALDQMLNNDFLDENEDVVGCKCLGSASTITEQ